MGKTAKGNSGLGAAWILLCKLEREAARPSAVRCREHARALRFIAERAGSARLAHACQAVETLGPLPEPGMLGTLAATIRAELGELEAPPA